MADEGNGDMIVEPNYRKDVIDKINRGERTSDPDADVDMLDAQSCMDELVDGYNTEAYGTPRYEAIMSRLEELATHLEPGTTNRVDNKHTLTSEQRLIGYVVAGYGKSQDGKPWAEVAYVDHSYHGPLKQ